MDTSAWLGYPNKLAFSCFRVRIFSITGSLSESPSEATVT